MNMRHKFKHKQALPCPIIRENPRGMNKTEDAYAWVLEAMKKSGEIKDYRFESINLRMADRTYYRPDFLVVFHTHFEIHEIKGGFVQDDAMVKFKATAELFPWFKWKMIQGKPHRGSYEWKTLKEF